MRGKASTWVVALALLLAAGAACAAPGSGGGEPAHTLRGEVATVDEARGMVTVKLAPSALKTLKKGDHVTVRLAGEHSGGERKPAKAATTAEESKSAAMPKGR
jgi:hypothetical protein